MSGRISNDVPHPAEFKNAEGRMGIPKFDLLKIQKILRALNKLFLSEIWNLCAKSKYTNAEEQLFNVWDFQQVEFK